MVPLVGTAHPCLVELGRLLSLSRWGVGGGGRVDFGRLPRSSSFPALLFLASSQASMSGDLPPRVLPGKPLLSEAHL